VATIVQSESIDGAGYVNLGQPAAINGLVARTYMYYGKPTGVENPGQICIKGDSASSGGPRFQISSSNSNAQFVTPTAASVLVPSFRGASGSVALGEWVNLAVSWDGVTAVNESGKIYKDGVREASPEASAGSSPYLDGTGFDLWLFNRPGAARALLGSHAYLAIWSRVLSDAEVATAVADGPLSVPDGLVLCWANGQDYSPHNIVPIARSAFVAGELPPNTALGESTSATHDLTAQDVTMGAPEVSSPALIVTGGTDELTAQDVTMGAPEVSTPALVEVAAQNLVLVAAGDSHNAHPTHSSVTDPGTTSPTVNVEVRVVYTGWRQFLFRLTSAAGKRPLFRITNPVDCVDTFRTSWRPWYSYDGVTWLRFDQAPTNNGSSWDFQHSAPFTGDTVYVAYQPAWPVSRAPWLIGELQALDADLVHALPSAPGFEFPTLLSPQVDELGQTVPGQKMHAFGVWDDALQPLDGSAKRIAVIVSGTHAGEHVGSWAMEGFTRFLFGGSAQATALLRNFRFLIYPCVNPMGRVMGHYRGQRQPGNYTLDPNRDWPEDNSASIFQSTQFLRAMIAADVGDNNAAFFADFHGTWGTATAFYYYNSNDPNADYLAEWDARVKTYSSFDDMNNITATTIAAGFARTYGPHHCYIPETYESSAFPGGVADVSGVGEVYARALADTPLAELRLPSEAAALVGLDVVMGVPDVTVPALGQIHVLGGADVSLGAPDVSMPYLVTSEGVDVLSGLDVQMAPFQVSVPELGQVHALVAHHVSMGGWEVGTPALFNGDFAPSPRVVFPSRMVEAIEFRARIARSVIVRSSIGVDVDTQ
jgi:hypothetical protein